ncbi:unnamed protein product [Rotaria sp. Silwood1]|nr:unnamed protein product [Rotaria sp. Silwood1]
MHRLIVISIFLSILYGIPFLVFYDIQPLSGTNTTTCRRNNNNGPFSKYVIYVSLPVIDGFIPIFIMSVAGFIAFRKDSFYIFLTSSARFRRQLKFVLWDVYLKQ